MSGFNEVVFNFIWGNNELNGGGDLVVELEG